MAERNLKGDIQTVREYRENVGTEFDRRVNAERMEYILGSGILEPDVVTHINLAIRLARLAGVIAGMEYSDKQDVAVEGEGPDGEARPLSSVIEEGAGWIRMKQWEAERQAQGRQERSEVNS